MTRKTKSIVVTFFIILLALIWFFVFRQKVFAPHTILIQNTNDESSASQPLDGLSDNTANPDFVNPAENQPADSEPEKIIKKPSANTDAAENLPASPASNPIEKTALKITPKLVSWGFSSTSNRKIDTIIIHSSYNALGGDAYDVEKLISEYKEYGVAPHYLIDRNGKIYQLVTDKNIAYHAGESEVPDGRTGVNNFSLGIEIMTTQEDSPTSAQYASLNSLLSTLKSRYSIKYVLGHSDIAPGRKNDPWNFEWSKIK